MNLSNFTINQSQPYSLIQDELFITTQNIISEVKSYFYDKLLFLLFLAVVLYFMIDREKYIISKLHKIFPYGVKWFSIDVKKFKIKKKYWTVHKYYMFMLQMITAIMFILITGLLFVKI